MIKIFFMMTEDDASWLPGASPRVHLTRPIQRYRHRLQLMLTLQNAASAMKIRRRNAK
jgi:hypothetical protein